MHNLTLPTMTLIKVDPGLLQSSGQDIQGNAQTISSAGSSVLDAASSAPSYNGQFGPLVAPIGQEAYAKLGSSANQLNDIGARLSFKGTEFQAVDNESLSDIGSTGGYPFSQFSDPSSGFSTIMENPTYPFLRLGGLINTTGEDINNIGAFITKGGSYNHEAWGMDPSAHGNWGGVPVAGQDKIDLLQAQAGFGVSGVYANATIASDEIDGAIGNTNFGLTGDVKETVGSVEAFAGVHDNEAGFKVGGDLVSAEASGGVNLGGANVSATAQVGVGFELGLTVGPTIQADLGPFEVSFSISPATGI